MRSAQNGPLSYLHDSERVTKEGLLGPQTICVKEEGTKRNKVYNSDGTKLKNPRFRVLKVQTFEDGLLARILTTRQGHAEKAAFSSPYSRAGSPVLVGAGHLGVGAELFWRHVDRCSDGRRPFTEVAGALGDLATTFRLDFEVNYFHSTTANLSRFCSVTASLIVGNTHTCSQSSDITKGSHSNCSSSQVSTSLGIVHGPLRFPILPMVIPSQPLRQGLRLSQTSFLNLIPLCIKSFARKKLRRNQRWMSDFWLVG